MGNWTKMGQTGRLVVLAVVALAAACGGEPEELEDCSGRVDCQRYGLCEWFGPGQCIAGYNAQCQVAEICHLEGKCKVEDRRCQALDDDDCKVNLPCKKYGRCRAVGGECVK